MERNDLRTEKIVTRGDVGRDGDDLLPAVGVQHVGAPVVGPDEAVLVDLEPAASHVLGSVADLGEVGDDGAVVVSTDGLVAAGAVAGLLVHFDSDSSTSGHAADTSDALGATSITLDVLRGNCQWMSVFRGEKVKGSLTAEVGLVMGLLLVGWRTQVPALSTPLTPSSWKVAWAAAEETAAKRLRIVEAFIAGGGGGSS